MTRRFSALLACLLCPWGRLRDYRALADAFAAMLADGRLASPMVDELEQVVSDLERSSRAEGGG